MSRLAANSCAAANSPGGAVADDAVRAMARAPKTMWATLSKKVESTPAEKATMTPSVFRSTSFNCSSFASIVFR